MDKNKVTLSDIERSKLVATGARIDPILNSLNNAFLIPFELEDFNKFITKFKETTEQMSSELNDLRNEVNSRVENNK